MVPVLLAWLVSLARAVVGEPVPGATFLGNTTDSNHFTLLTRQPGSVLVGGRNALYNLSLPGLHELAEERISWECSSDAEQLCLMKGRSRSECANYLRVYARLDGGTLLLCGTHCFSPLCRHYRTEAGGGHTMIRQFSGRGYAPFHPAHNSSYLYTRGSLYAATVADFSATDSLIIKNQLRTEQWDYRHLNAPDFVSSLEDEDHVYFFLREAAVEYMNCGKAVYSRVARVCKNDEGGSHKFSNRWTTFLKARLNCSLPGDYPFYFDNIQSTSSWHREGSSRVFYAVFTTPTNSIPGSAVCRFTMDDITASFDGDFKTQASVNSNWLPLSSSAVPSPRPGSCHNSSSSLPESSLHFIANHCLMDRAVPSSPVFLRSGDSELLTRVVLHPGLRDLAGRARDLLYIGTNRGRVLRVALEPGGRDSEVLEEIQVFPPDTPVMDLVLPSPSSPLLLVLSADTVHSLPLARCQHASCSSCLAPSSSPHCAWHTALSTCAAHMDVRDRTRMVHRLPECPEEEQGENESQKISPTRTGSSQQSDLQLLRAHPIVILVSTAGGSLLLGFLIGVLVSRFCRSRSSVSVTSSSVSLVKPSTSGEEDTSSYSEASAHSSSENNSCEGGERIGGKGLKKTETWPRFSYTGTLQKVKRIYL